MSICVIYDRASFRCNLTNPTLQIEMVGEFKRTNKICCIDLLLAASLSLGISDH